MTTERYCGTASSVVKLGQKADGTAKGMVTLLQCSSLSRELLMQVVSHRGNPLSFWRRYLLCLPFSCPVLFFLLAIAAVGQSADETGLCPIPVSHFPVISLGYQSKDTDVFSGLC